MAFLHSEPVSEGVGLNCRIASFLGEKEWGGGKGGVGGGSGGQMEGRRRQSWKVGGITLYLEIKIPIFFLARLSDLVLQDASARHH